MVGSPAPRVLASKASFLTAAPSSSTSRSRARHRLPSASRCQMADRSEATGMTWTGLSPSCLEGRFGSSPRPLKTLAWRSTSRTSRACRSDAYTNKAMLISRKPPSVGKSRQEGHPEFGDLSGHVAPRVPDRIPHHFAVSGRRVPRPVPGMPARRRRARTGSTSQTGDRGRTSRARPPRWRRSCRRRRGASEGCS